MFKDRIQGKYESLSARFRVIADFILEHTLEASFMTATELARRLDIDPATVVRFAQELGYSGYRELGREIKRYVSTDLQTRYQRPVEQAQTQEERIEHLIVEQGDRVLELKSVSRELAEAVRHLHEASQVIFTGKGDSLALAQIWAMYFNLIGLKALALPMHGIWFQALEPGTVLVSFSVGLDTESDVTLMMRTLKARGVYTIAVLPTATLPTAREADLHIVPNTNTPAQYPVCDTLMMSMSLIWQALIMLNPQKARARTREILATLFETMRQDGEAGDADVAVLKRLWGIES